MPLVAPGVRRCVAGMAALGLALIASGCVNSDFTFTVHDDGTVSGSVLFAVDEGWLEDGVPQEEALQNFYDNAQSDPSADVPGEIDVVDYDDGGYLGREVHFADVSPDDLADRYDEHGFTLVHEDDMYRFDLELDLTEHEQLDDDMRSNLTVTVAATFPGPVVETDGEILDDESTVVWRLTMVEPRTLYAVAEDAPPEPEVEESSQETPEETSAGSDASPADMPWWVPAAVIAGMVAALAVAALVWWMRRPRVTIAPALPSGHVDLPPANNNVTQEMPVVRPDTMPPDPPRQA